VIGFAFDPVKSDANQRKHGIDFLAAQALWRDPALLEIPARTTGEPRFLMIARRAGPSLVCGDHLPRPSHSPDLRPPITKGRDRAPELHRSSLQELRGFWSYGQVEL